MSIANVPTTRRAANLRVQASHHLRCSNTVPGQLRFLCRSTGTRTSRSRCGVTAISCVGHGIGSYYRKHQKLHCRPEPLCVQNVFQSLSKISSQRFLNETPRKMVISPQLPKPAPLPTHAPPLPLPTTLPTPFPHPGQLSQQFLVETR